MRTNATKMLKDETNLKNLFGARKPDLFRISLANKGVDPFSNS